MRFMLAFLLGLVALSGSAIAEVQPVADPDQYAKDIMAFVSNGDEAGVAKKITQTLGKPEAEQTFENGLGALKGKKVDLADKVIDKTFGKSLRKIVYYCYVENIGYVYFRFNFKLAGNGWHMVHFMFRSETQELFPKDFIESGA